MANANVGFGLKPINTAGSTPATSGTNAYFIDSAASAIFQGSPVIATNGGEIAVSSSASGDTLKFVGVFAGCEYVSSSTGKKVFSNYWPGSGADTNFDIIGHVYDNPMQRFLVSADEANTDRDTAKADIFKTATLASGTGGSTTTGISSTALDISTAEDTDTSNPLMILGLHEDPENSDHTAANATYIVKINNHALMSSDVDATAS